MAMERARARCMTWRVNFVRSKGAQKQLARTSLKNSATKGMLNAVSQILIYN